MAMIKCPECGKEISDKAGSCPNCGCPSSEILKPKMQRLEENETAELKRMFDNSKIDFHMDISSSRYIEIRENYMYVKNCTLTKNLKVIDSKPDKIENFTLLYEKTYFGFEHDIIINHDEFSRPMIVTIYKKNKEYDKSFELSKILEEKATVNKMGRIAAINYETTNQKKRRKEYEKCRKVEKPRQDSFLESVAKSVENTKVPKCPKCGSTSISYDTKKLSVGRALVGDAVAGPAGAVLGGLSSKKGYSVCLNCGKRWKI